MDIASRLVISFNIIIEGNVHRYLAGCMVLGFMHPMCASEKSLISDTGPDASQSSYKYASRG